MLFLPKYGTIEVCAVARRAGAATSSATSNNISIGAVTRAGEGERSGTRVRISVYLEQAGYEGACLILQSWRTACKRCARPGAAWPEPDTAVRPANTQV